MMYLHLPRAIVVALTLMVCSCNRNGTQTTSSSQAPEPSPAAPPAATQSPPPPSPPATPSNSDNRKSEISNLKSGHRSELPRISQERYTGPRVTVQILQRESHPVQYVAQVSLTAPTGGWSLQLDETHIVNGVAKIFMTLERPAPHEMVTQALVNHNKDFVSTQPFKSAEVYIHLAQRGVQTLTTDYRLAGRSQ